tara:strand:+ start:166 stop:474 length:309 start_codon:yes stop_codon:yes gene_type:complete
MKEKENVVSIDNKKAQKPFWKKHFHSIPEVLTVPEIAEYLRIQESHVMELINNESIKTVPGTNDTRIFKGFLYAFLTQNPPKQIGLSGGMPNSGIADGSIGF